ncbi:MAG: O-methyltransferase [Clostridia bacterium]
MEPIVVGSLTENYIRENLKQDAGILATLRAYAAQHNVPVITLEVKKLLEVILAIHPPTRVLEIGTAIGYSSIFFAQTMTNGGQIDTIEVDPDMVILARENIKTASIAADINVICGDALDVLPCLTGTYDLIFVDGPKAKYIEMLPECMRLLAQKGLLITDNILYRGFVATPDTRVPQQRRSLVRNLRAYIKLLCTMDNLETTVIPIGDGVSISIRK